MKAKTKKTSKAKKARTKKRKQRLVIVESPAKAKTINKYLGSEYSVMSCMGHIIDLPKSRMAVNIENGFEPEYITVRGKGKLLQELKRKGRDSSEVLVASDNDREGEAIAFHLAKVLTEKNKDVPVSRISFNEITKDVIKEAVKHPREIDMGLVYAQKARRVLDRLVGYSISPLLWEKIKKGLSAGRVQSVALNLICVREDEILNFDPQEYWTIQIDCVKEHIKKPFTADLLSFQGARPVLDCKAAVDTIVGNISGKDAVVSDLIETVRNRKPSAPYTTSRLQQEAATRFGFSSSKTMMIAQRLYEGISLGRELTGLITYMRTDSVRISDIALSEVRTYISEHFPACLPDSPNEYKSGKKAQEAHEAIRPTSVAHTPESIKRYLEPDEFKLYSLIWERFVSSQMKSQEVNTVRIILQVGDAEFSLSGSVITFEGFTQVFHIFKNEVKMNKLPVFSKGEILKVDAVKPEQHFTSPPPRFNDASIVKALEESGIGRPSTYAPTIERLIRKYYAKRVKRQLVPTVLGSLVNNLMEKNFTELLNVNFTAKMEEDLDKVAENSVSWVSVISDFYAGFKVIMESARANIAEMKSILDEPTGLSCPKCGKQLMKKLGKFGYFIACEGFPECRFTESVSLGDCPVESCSGKIIARKSRKGRDFYGCSRYPECSFVSWNTPLDAKCPACGSMLFESGSKKKGICTRMYA